MKIIVTGAGGQDGYYLINWLTGLGHDVCGTVRSGDPARYKYLNIDSGDNLMLVQADLLDYSSLLSLRQLEPDMVINLAGLTSPPAAWGTPELTLSTNGMGPVRLMEVFNNPDLKFIQFGSIAEFGPYGASKLYAEKMMDDYRVRGYHVSTIRFAGHHSPRRSPVFFSKKVVQAVAAIKAGLQGDLQLGPVSRSQDWGAAPDFMQAVIEIMDKEPGTYTVSTGDPHTLTEFVDLAFEAAGLTASDYVSSDTHIVQPTDVESLSVKPDSRLSWRPGRTFEGLVDWLVQAEMAALKDG